MSLIDKKLLQKAMDDADIKAAPLALSIKRDKDYIRDFLQGRKASLKMDDAQKIADALHVPLSALTGGRTGDLAAQGLEIAGTVSAGVYRDISIEDQDGERPRISFARDMRFPDARQYALKVDGDSMNLLFPDGSVVVVVDLIDSGLTLKTGMSVHVERFVMGGQFVETTLKEVHREPKGKGYLLKPRSSNPTHEPIHVNGNEGDEVIIKGVVIGKWEPVNFGF